MSTQARAIWERLRRWKLDPAAFVREELKVDPFVWQLEALEAYRTSNRIALKACKGPGKTAVLAWCIWHFLSFNKEAKVGATSITGDNLDTNLWPELAKWRGRSPFLKEAFEWTKTRLVNRKDPDNWFAVARAWPKKADQQAQADALAGIHADNVMFVLDESGGIPQAVMATAEAVLATGGNSKVLQAGNPTHTTGPLYRACTIDRKLWKVITITGDPDDPRRSPNISREWAQQQIDSYGRENPWVLVNVLGEFPPASINALLGVEEVEAAMRRHYTRDAYEWAEKRIGVDVARFGDDRTIIFPRQGVWAARPQVLRQQRTTTIAAKVARGIQRWTRAGGDEVLTLVDDSGHWGHGVVDNLITAGYPVIPVMYGDPAPNRRYKNVRTQNWLEMADWVKAGGALPHIPEMVPELTEPTYIFLGGVFVLEEKQQIKDRLGWSPDYGDALSNTFALPDRPAGVLERLRKKNTTRHEFDPYAENRDRSYDEGDRPLTDFDPLEVDL